jgi:hypothetical protein
MDPHLAMQLLTLTAEAERRLPVPRRRPKAMAFLRIAITL